MPETKSDIPVCLQRSIPILCRLERRRYQVALFHGYAAIQEVVGVAWVTGDVQLRHQWLAAPGPHRHVNVRRASRIGHRPDGAETVTSLRVGGGVSEALEARVDKRWRYLEEAAA